MNLSREIFNKRQIGRCDSASMAQSNTWKVGGRCKHRVYGWQSELNIRSYSRSVWLKLATLLCIIHS